MSWVEALLLGLVQGLTEFLPVSSSGHLEIGNALLGTRNADNLLFAIVVHLATAIATLVVFRKDISHLLGELLKFQWNVSTQFVMKIMVSMIPVFIVGVFFKHTIESFFTGNLILVGAMLLITGMLLLSTHYRNAGKKEIGYFAALIIGIAQAFAVLPGISRAGATISTALFLGISRTQAARFSFLMVLVPIIGASILQVKDYLAAPALHTIAPLSLAIGFVAAFVSGFVACKWMLRIVKNGKLTYFAVYCFIVGGIALAAG